MCKHSKDDKNKKASTTADQDCFVVRSGLASTVITGLVVVAAAAADG